MDIKTFARVRCPADTHSTSLPAFVYISSTCTTHVHAQLPFLLPTELAAVLLVLPHLLRLLHGTAQGALGFCLSRGVRRYVSFTLIWQNATNTCLLKSKQNATHGCAFLFRHENTLCSNSLQILLPSHSISNIEQNIQLSDFNINLLAEEKTI